MPFWGATKVNISEDRRIGYEKAMNEAGQAIAVTHTNMTKEAGYTRLKNMAKTNNLPRAIIGINDAVAQGAHKAILELGLRIPEDVAVAGFGDLTTSRVMKPSLTTIRSPLRKMAKHTIDTIIDMIENGTEVVGNTHFDGELIEREST